MTTYSWKLVNTYTGTDFNPKVLSLSNSGTTIVSGSHLYFTVFRLEHSVLNNLGQTIETDEGQDPDWISTSISPSGQYIARTLENRIKIYTNVGFGNWAGTELYHAPNNDYFGASSSFDVTGTNTWIAAGAPRGHLDTPPLFAKGYAKVFNYTNNTQIDSDIIGDDFGDNLGAVVLLRNNTYLVCGQGKIYLADLVSGNWQKTQVVNDTFSFFIGSGNTIQDVNYTIAANGDLTRYVKVNGPMNINYNPRTTDPNIFTNSQQIQASSGSLGFVNVDMDNTGNVILAGFQDGSSNVNYVKTYRFSAGQFTVAETINIPDGPVSMCRLSGDGTRIVVAGIATGGLTTFLSVYDYTLDTIVPNPEDPDPTPEVPSIPTTPGVTNPSTSASSGTSTKKISITLIVIIIVVAIIVALAVGGAVVGGYFFLRKK